MKLGTKLTILFLILTLIPLGLVGYVGFDRARDAINRNLRLHLSSVNLLKENELDRWLQGNAGLLAALAQRPLVRQHVAMLIARQRDEAAYQTVHDMLLANHLTPTLTEGVGFLNLSVLQASDGMILASTDPDLTFKYRESEPFFQEGLKGTFVGDVVYSLPLGRAVMRISTPVRDEAGDVIAVLSGHADLEQMTEIMGHHVGLSESEDSYLVNDFNFFVTEPRFGQGYALKEAIHTEGVEACLQGQDGIGYYPDYRGVPVIGAYRWIPEREMCILTEVDQAEAYAPIVSLRNNTLGIGLGMGLAVVLLGLGFTRTITGPLGQLVRGTREVGRGNLDYRLSAQTNDEIGEVARAFNRMTENLQSTIVSRDTLAKEVAARKRMERELRRSNEELQQFAYVASHDLQEPLRMVSSFTQLLSRRYRDELDQDAQDFIDYAVDGANRMQDLINDLLAFSRVNTRGESLVPVDAGAALGQARANLRLALEDSRGLITNEDLPRVMADEGQLVRVFQNLLGNAIKYAGEEPPRIHISAERQAEMWRFAVEDNGIGIEPQYHERIFIIFQQLHGREEYGGTGIGLAICKRIVERHGGQIWVESALGEGATFYFTLPAVA
jgi:signal transduction histidine kinase